MDSNIKHKEDNNQGMFFIEDNDEIVAEVTYTLQDNGILTIDETETDPRVGGKGLGSKLIKRVVAHAKENNLTVDPLCSFAAAQFDKHPEYQEVQAQE